MTLHTKPTRDDASTARPVPDAGRGPGRRGRRSAARKALDRTMGRLAAPVADPLNPDGVARADWDASLPPLLLDGDFDEGDEGAVALALCLLRAVRDEEDDWSRA